MGAYRTRDQMLLAELETTPAETWSDPDPATDMVRTTDAQPGLNLDWIQTEYATGKLDVDQGLPGGIDGSLRVQTYLCGTGTAGVAPDWGRLLRACGMGETITAAAVTGTADAGTADSITLALGASATDGAYVGMPIVTTAGTGSGQTRVISAYDGATLVATVTPAWDTTPDATTEYEIPVNVLYAPTSEADETLRAAHYQGQVGGDSRRRRYVGLVGTFRLQLQPRRLATLEVQLQGALAGNDDEVTRPSPTTPSGIARPLQAAQAYTDGGAVAYGELSFQMGNRIILPEDPAATYGTDRGLVIAREPEGRITPRMAALSTRDAMADWLAATAWPIWTSWGPSAGNRISVFLAGARLKEVTREDLQGLAAEGIAFEASRNDDAIRICVW
jgi:hypothetical protein